MLILHALKKELFAKIVTYFFIVLTVWWLLERLLSSQNPAFESTFAHVYGFISLFGGIWGLVTAKKWGGFGSLMGKALGFLSIGLLAQFFGQFSYSLYFFVFKLEVPYPSIGDVGFFSSILFYIFGVWYLAQISGVKFGLKTVLNKIQAVIIPLFMLMVAYYLFLKGYEFDWSNPLTVFLDFGYPFGQAFYISLAFLTYLLSRNVLGGVMKTKIIFILVALLAQFLSDYMFLYQALNGTWHPGGFNDFLYLISYFLMSIALIQLKTVYDTIQNST